MKKKKIRLLKLFSFAFIFWFLIFPEEAEASGGEEYITIEVQASDDNEGLKYAIDSDDESAFSDTNEFTIPAGTSHTIYVKDAAGNITSQTYTPDNNNGNNVTGSVGDAQEINIDLELGNSKKDDYSSYEYLTDDPIESGTGTVNSKIKTDGSDNAEKVFYTVSTDTGEVFYLVIDQSQSKDNVYLLNGVTLDDLKSLAMDGDSQNTENAGAEDNLLSALQNNNKTEDGEIENENTASGSGGKKSNFNNKIILLICLAIGGGIYYYLKVYKNKKDEMMDTMDAMDMEDFETGEDDDEGEEVDFEVDDEEKEQFLNQLIEDDEEELYHEDPEEYYKKHEQTKKEEDSEDDAKFEFDEDNDDEEEEE